MEEDIKIGSYLDCTVESNNLKQKLFTSQLTIEVLVRLIIPSIFGDCRDVIKSKMVRENYDKQLKMD